MRDDCGVPSWRPCCETGASARLCGGLWGAGSCWHLHVFSVGHVWEADLYPAVSVRVGAARFLNEHLSVNIVCCPVLIPEHMRSTLVLLRASPIIGLIGRAHFRTLVTNAHLVCWHLLDTKNHEYSLTKTRL